MTKMTYTNIQTDKRTCTASVEANVPTALRLPGQTHGRQQHTPKGLPIPP